MDIGRITEAKFRPTVNVKYCTEKIIVVYQKSNSHIKERFASPLKLRLNTEIIVELPDSVWHQIPHFTLYLHE